VKVAPEQMGKGGSAYKLCEGDRLDEAPPMQGRHTQSDPSQRAGQWQQSSELEAGPKEQGRRQHAIVPQHTGKDCRSSTQKEALDQRKMRLRGMQRRHDLQSEAETTP
jgi:hypothetical protein